ncbi:hypothetical protein SISSUDRAFT_1064237 [Sistotremastrum suecicum HHB10207 ss-3]|uniref:Uncharacterized protein n=1 Tax=Sistotremastrum suecicum HHB10207 ss-3 TaxID=1314776 RepID=A0A166AWA9_9AGAM|nr:hypothetical protein SISSUDRAFT_1064237 [Sistotremastrum suecicum HHB10207 ss-3]
MHAFSCCLFVVAFLQLLSSGAFALPSPANYDIQRHEELQRVVESNIISPTSIQKRQADDDSKTTTLPEDPSTLASEPIDDGSSAANSTAETNASSLSSLLPEASQNHVGSGGIFTGTISQIICEFHNACDT